MKIRNLLLLLLTCTASITNAQTDPERADDTATMLMSDAPPQIEIFLLDGSKFRVRKVAELSSLVFKSISSYKFYSRK